jgi:putative tryptophan/tyrosine transport system substrate-binding protein
MRTWRVDGRLSRRAFVAVLGASTAGLALISGCRAPAPESRVRPSQKLIGYLAPATATPPDAADPFWQALRVLGWELGRDLAVEYRGGSVTGRTAPLFAGLARELVGLDVALMLTQGEPATRAAKEVTTTIPIFCIAGDPVSSGLVDSLARPGGNVTGVRMLNPELSAKMLELLREVAPGLRRVAVLWFAAVEGTAHQFRQVERAAQALGMVVHSLEAGIDTEVPPALAAISPHGTEGLIVTNAATYYAERHVIVDFAATSGVPAIYPARDFVAAGGLIAYGPQPIPLMKRAAVQVDRLLRGAKPADVPIEQPEEFDLLVNLTAAQTLGLSIPPHVAAQVTEWVQ